MFATTFKHTTCLLRPATSRTMSLWSHVPQGPPDAILGITVAFNKDPLAEKINLGVGAYRDDNGRPVVLRCVQEAEKRMLRDGLNKEYAGITGIPAFVAGARKLAYSNAAPADHVVISQSISGTGALRLGAEFLARWYPGVKTVHIPTPTWPNHGAVFNNAGLKVEKYRYYDKKTIGLDLDGMLADIRSATDRSIFLLHACAHNPTGVDPEKHQWDQIQAVIAEKGHLVFFDMAYQGFASGNLDTDAYALRQFVKGGVPVCLAQSFAKNMGLYGERVGAFSVVCSGPEEYQKLDSQVKILVRPMYSNPPIHGAHIASTILNDPELYSQWQGELQGMADRIKDMRALLRKELDAGKSGRDWSHLTKQIGMFAYTGLTPEQMQSLASDHSVYATLDGRISVAGITTKNISRLATSINKVLEHTQPADSGRTEESDSKKMASRI